LQQGQTENATATRSALCRS